jgi:site-specific recombinase XerD
MERLWPFLSERSSHNPLSTKSKKTKGQVKPTLFPHNRVIIITHPTSSPLANKGVGVRLLAALAGHSHISTTQRYIDVNAEQLSAAVELL